MIKKIIVWLLMGLSVTKPVMVSHTDNIYSKVNSREDFSSSQKVNFIQTLDEYNGLLVRKADMTVKDGKYYYNVCFTETNEQTTYVKRNIPYFMGRDEERVQRIYNWVLKVLEYDHTLKNRNAYLGMTTGKTVCIGYSQLFYLACLKNGIQCHIRYSKDHCWNNVLLDNKWYNVDCTWGDSAKDKNYWFLKGSENWETDISHVAVDKKSYLISYLAYNR